MATIVTSFSFAVRETASLGIMGEPRVPPCTIQQGNWISESTIVSGGFKGGTRGAPIIPRDAVSRTANVGTVGMNGLIFALLNRRAAELTQNFAEAFEQIELKHQIKLGALMQEPKKS